MVKSIFGVFLILALLLCACSVSLESTPSAQNSEIIITQGDQRINEPYIFVILDKKNKQEYIVVRCGNGISITPRIVHY
jgi:hypothetical protein